MNYHINIASSAYEPDEAALVTYGSFEFRGNPIAFSVTDANGRDPVVRVNPTCDDDSDALYRLVQKEDSPFYEQLDKALRKYALTDAFAIAAARYLYGENLPWHNGIFSDAESKRRGFDGYLSMLPGPIPAFGYKVDSENNLIGVYLWNASGIEIGTTSLPADLVEQIRRAIRVGYAIVIDKEKEKEN